MESLWPSISEQSIEENLSLSILRDQASFIKKETNNRIRATFSKVSYKPGPLSASKQLGEMISNMTSSVYEENVEDELQNKKNINDLFSIIKYKFEIYNDEYRYRLFVVNYSELYPISLCKFRLTGVSIPLPAA